MKSLWIQALVASWATALLVSCTPKVEEPEPNTTASPAEETVFPGNPFLMVAFHPGRVLEKLDYDGLVNKPIVANLYASLGLSQLDLNLREDRARNGFLTQLVETPVETSGVDPSKPVYLSIPGLNPPRFRVVGKIGDPATFEDFVLSLFHYLRVDPKTMADSEEGLFRSLFSERIVAAHDRTSFLLEFAPFKDPTQGWVKPDFQSWAEIDQHILKGKGEDGEAFDALATLRLEPALPILQQLLKPGETLPDFAADTVVQFSLRSDPGRLDAGFEIDIGKDHPLDLGGEPLGEDFSESLEGKGFLYGSLSVQPKNFQQILPLARVLSMELKKYPLIRPLVEYGLFHPYVIQGKTDLGEAVKELFKIPPGELPDHFTGQAAVCFNHVIGNMAQSTFMLALGTNQPAKGLYGQLANPSKETEEEKRYFHSAQGNLLRISSDGFARIHDLGEPASPIREDRWTNLQGGLANLEFDFQEFLMSIHPELKKPQPIQHIPLTGEMMPGVVELFSGYKGYRLKVDQTGPSTFKGSYEFRLLNTDRQALHTLSHAIAEYGNPYQTALGTRRKLQETELAAQKNPGYISGKIPGTWIGVREGPKCTVHFLETYRPDGTCTLQAMETWKEGYIRTRSDYLYKIKGTTCKFYNPEGGGLEHVTSLLDFEESSMVQADGWNLQVGLVKGLEPVTFQRAKEGTTFPPPPEGLLKMAFYQTNWETGSLENVFYACGINNIVTNLEGEDKNHAVNVSFDILCEGEEFAKLVKTKESEIRKAGTEFLSTISPNSWQDDPQILSKTKKFLVGKLNGIPGIDGRIQDISFTEVRLQ